MSEKKPLQWVMLNAAYTFILFAAAIAAAMVAKLILNLFLPIDLTASQGGDYSRNFFLVFPIYGVVSGIAFMAVCFFGSKTEGFRMGFRYRNQITTPVFIAQAVIGVIIYYFLFLYMCEWWENLPSWYLAGFVAAVTKVIDASNIYNTVAEGYAEIENLYFHYFGIHVLLELLFVIASVYMMRIGRRKGELRADEEHKKQLAELEQEKDRLANAKTLKK